MKKIIIALLLLGSIFVNAFAQEYDVVEAGQEVDFNNNEVYLAVGAPSGIGIIVGLGGALAEAFGKAISQAAGQDSSNNDESASAAKDSVISAVAGYNYFFNPHFGVGGFVSFEKFQKFMLFSVQAKITGQYGWEHFKIYHSLSGGVMIIPGADKPNFMADITWLGLKLDFQNWNVFVDASIPSTGLIKAGASFKF